MIFPRSSTCTFLIAALLLSGFHVFAQTTPQSDQQIGSYTRSGNHFTFKLRNEQARVEFCTPSMFRVRISKNGQFEENENLMVVKYNWPEIALKTDETDDRLLIISSELEIIVDKDPFLIEVTDKDGKVLSTERFDGITGGIRENGGLITCTKALMPEEHFFGFGERMDYLDRRGKSVKLNVGRGLGRPHVVGAYNILEANYCPVPFFMSTRGYGIFLHNSYASTWDMGNSTPKAYSFTAEGGHMDYYFIKGPKFTQILDQYTQLTGRSPLIPRFALGLHVGTYSGGTWGHEASTSDAYVIALVRKFRELGIPIDILHLDSTWRIFGESGGKGATSFEWRETFKRPKLMFDSLYALNLNMVGLHIRPRLDNGRKYRLLDDARAAGLVYPEENNPGEFVNYFDDESVQWWWDHGLKTIADSGAMFVKTDEGSAFGRQANESDKVGPQGEVGRKLHNVFPIAYAKAPYEKFAEYNGLRGINHTREGWAGIQRYPFIFAGDWPSEWQYFAPVIRGGLNIGISGVGYWSHCMGGFEHVADPELYIRWCQFGMFSPISHLFGMEHPTYKEPWSYGKDIQEIFKKYDQIRYRLNPYIYSYAYEQYQTGMPLMRALVLEYQDDPNVYGIDDQYLFGDDLMVCPVTTKDAKSRIVYFPKGIWFDYFDGTRYEGGRSYNVLTPLDKMPIYVKAGAIIPTQEDVQYIGKGTFGKITLDIYPESDGSFGLYEDDGRTEAYKEGEFAITTIQKKGKQVSISASKGKYPVPDRAYQLKIKTDKAPGTVKVAIGSKRTKELPKLDKLGKATQAWLWDEEQKCLVITYLKKTDQEINFSFE